MNITRLILPLLPATLLPMAIASLPVKAQQPAGTEQSVVTYQCNGGKTFQAEYMPEGARVVLGEQTLTLSQVQTGSGARYSDGQTTLYTKGEEAFVEEGTTRTYDACVAQAASGSAQTTGAQTTGTQTTGTQSTGAQTSGTQTSGSSSSTSSQTTVIQRNTTSNETNPSTTTAPRSAAQGSTQQQAAPAQQQDPVRALW